jgi:hypothetical protein
MRADGLLGRSRCYAMQNDTASGLSSLEQALNEYPYDTKVIAEDKAFEKLKDIEQFKIIITKYNSSDDNRTHVLFTLFEKNFGKASLPYSIPPDSVGIHTGKMIDFRYADFIAGMSDGQFSRTVEKVYQYTAALDLSSDYKTFIYRTLDYNGDSIFPAHQYIMTVDKDDKMIGQQEIACACSPLTIKTAVIDSDAVVEVKEIAQTWKEDPIYKGYAGNEVIKQEVKSVKLYQVMPDGKIEAIRQRPAKKTDSMQAENEQDK